MEFPAGYPVQATLPLIGDELVLISQGGHVKPTPVDTIAARAQNLSIPWSGLFSTLHLASIASVITIIQTSGYGSVGVGAAKYARSTQTGTTAWRAQSVDGAWWELCEDVVTPQMLGSSVGDGTTIDRPAHQTWWTYLSNHPVKGFCPPSKVKYLFDAITVSIFSNTDAEFASGSIFDADLTGIVDWRTLPAFAPAGSMFIFVADDGLRSGHVATPVNQCVLSGLTIGPDITRNVRLSGHMTIACSYAGAQLTGETYYGGFQLFTPYNVDMSDLTLDVSGTPNDGFQMLGGNKIRLPKITAQRCGYKGPTGSSRNGISIVGSIISGAPELSSTDVTGSELWSHYNHDVGVATAAAIQLSLNRIVARGNGQIGLEGVSAFLAPSGTSTAPDGQRILYRLQLNEYIFSGLLDPALAASLVADGTVVTGTTMANGQGIGIDTGAEVQVDIEQVSIEDCVPTNTYPIVVSSQVKGRVRIGSTQLENVTGANGLVYCKADEVDIANVNAIGCTGSKSIFGGLNITKLKLRHIRSDADISENGMYIAGTTATEVLIDDVGTTGSVAQSGMVFNYVGRVEALRVENCKFRALNTAGSASHGFIEFQPDYPQNPFPDKPTLGTIGSFVVVNNDAPVPSASAAWINATAFQPSSGDDTSYSVDSIRVMGNREGTPMVQASGPSSIYGSHISKMIEDRDNDVPGQRVFPLYEPSTVDPNYWSKITTVLSTLQTTVGNMVPGDRARVNDLGPGVPYEYVLVYGPEWQIVGGSMSNVPTAP